MEECVHHVYRSPLEKAGFLSQLLFTWISSILKIGYKRKLNVEDLHNVTHSDSSHKLYTDLDKHWRYELRNKRSPSLFRAVARDYWRISVVYTLFGILDQSVRMSLPLQLSYLIRYFANDDEERISSTQAYVLAGTITGSTFVMSLFHHPFLFGMQRIAMRIRIALCSMIYKKSLRLSYKSMAKANTGHIVNLMSNDVSRLDSACMCLPYLVIAPLEMVVIYYVLDSYIGIATLPGYLLMLLLILAQTIAAKYFYRFRSKIAVLTDKRVHLMSEILAGMRVIKLYCWEAHFSELILKIRRLECNKIFQSAILKSLILCGPYFSMAKLSIGLSIVVFTIPMGGELSPRAIFVIIGFYNILRLHVGWLVPYALQQLSEIRVVMRRIQEFLELEEYDTCSIMNDIHTTPHADDNDESLMETDKSPLLTNAEPEHKYNGYGSMKRAIRAKNSKRFDLQNIGDNIIEVKHTSTIWKQPRMNGKVPVIDNLSFNIKKGELIAIIGSVGSGKTSLLLSLLGELPLTDESSVRIGSQRISYSAQEAWVFSSSIRQNILFGKPMDNKRYRRIIDSVSLTKDIDLMPERDGTLVGERGMSLSGGQRSRIGLARAVYSDADIILMDDPLSAVDLNVGKHLFNKCIKGELRNKTRLLVTHQLQYIKNVDRIIILKEGRIVCFDTYESLLESETELATFLGEENLVNKTDEVERLIERLEETFISSVIFNDSLNKVKTIELEDMSSGNIGFGTYRKFLSYGTGIAMISLSLGFTLLLNFSNVFNDWYLAKWSDDQQEYNRLLSDYNHNNNNNTTMADYNTTMPQPLDIANYLTIYCSNIVFLSIIASVNGIIVYSILIKTSKKLHTDMLTSILRTPIAFFDNNPVGRILNRFSKDLGQLDELMPSLFYEYCKCFFAVLSIIAVTAMSMPIVIVAVVPLTAMIYYIRNYYVHTSREVKRLEGATRSPVFTHVSASMVGLATVRAFSRQPIFEREFDQHQDQHTEAWFLYIASSRWMSLRLDATCALFVGLLSFVSVAYGNALSSGVVGLMLTYSFAMINTYSWFIRQNVEVENMMTSVERIMDYINITPEASLTSSPGKEPPSDWPISGGISALGVSMRYAENSPNALNNLKFDIRPREKIGIVGRTGAGKSSLISMLFRLTEHHGSLTIDGVDISGVGLHDLRTRLSIIPQDPILFVGTLRENLDPFSKYEDSILWNALREVQILESINTSNRGLEMEVREAGSNFSVGQRQLICLARALLNKNKIIIIDEATANVDNQTDELIQRTIREKFADCTILTIAHRIHTILDSDRIMVMDKGIIVEFDSPEELLNRKEGYFYELFKKIDKNSTLIKNKSN